MTLKVRGSNPVWANFDLQGLIFDDSFYLYILENQIPYIPSTEVFLDENGNTSAPNPIQYLANGTLPVDIFFTPGVTYRLEFRKNDGTAPPSQNDALIYLVEDYKPSDSSDDPTPSLSLNSDNQITNPQFPGLYFSLPKTFSGISNTSIAIAQGWDIVVVGTGNVTVTRLQLTSSDNVPTNAPFALQVQTTGFTSAYLRQRFIENGTLWGNHAVSSSITARTADTIAHTMRLTFHNNASSPQQTLINDFTLTTAWQEYTNAVEIPESNNETATLSAYTELRISLPATGTVAVTSVQLLGQESPVALPYEQEPINRQIDHLYHTAQPVVPVGAVIDYAASTTLPRHYLECNGAAVSRTTYNLLFNAIGTIWGSGDGSTTFNLPNLNGLVTAGRNGTLPPLANTVGSTGGSATHTIAGTELPEHTHSAATGPASGTGGASRLTSSASGGAGSVGPNTTTNDPMTIVQPTAIMKKIIRYQ